MIKIHKRVLTATIIVIMLFLSMTPCFAAEAETDPLALTDEEALYILSSEPITVGVIEDRYPFSEYNDETGEISGIFVDLCELLSEKSGLTFNYALIPQGVRGVDWLEQGNGRMIAGIFYSDLNMPSDRLEPTETLFPSSYVLIGRKGEQFDNDAAVRVAIPIGFIGGEQFTATQYPNAEIVSFANNEECIDAVASGKADVLFQDMYIANRMLQSPRYEKLMIYPAYQIPLEMKLVTLKTDDALLQSVLNKAVVAISDAEIDHIVLLYTVAKPYQPTWQDTYYKYKVPIHIIGALFICLIALMIVYILSKQKHEKHILEINKELEVACKQTQIASKAKGDFLARMSHEIRTPMNAVIGLTALAEDHVNEPDTVLNYLEKIASSSKLLLSIINDVLDMSSIEAGKIHLAHAQFNFNQLISSLTAVYYTQCQQKGISFSAKVGGNVDEILIGDSLRLNQILMNLLSNAVKFTDKGSITMKVDEQSVSKDKLFLRITVADTGSGMNHDMKSRLWKPFEQQDASTAEKHGGSGLGLAIVKNLVSLMGGAIDVKSAPNEGTIFTVDLPFDRCEQGELQPDGALTKLHILAVDDEKDALEYACSVLKKIGVQFDATSSSEEALQMLAKAQCEGKPYNVCMIDWKMPGLNGFDLTEKIRAAYGRDATVIIASAYDYSAIAAQAKSIGVDRYLSKPLFPSSVYDTLLSLPIVGNRAIPSSDAAYDLAGKHVLLAEDNDLNRIVAIGFLKKAGVTCDIAENGKKALEKFLVSQPGFYDAILMDMEMPEMDGIEATKAIRASAHPDAKRIPILAMTANAFTGDIARCLQSGMNGHIAKPIVLSTLLSTLNNALQGEGKHND